jgi:hypothetical protein
MFTYAVQLSWQNPTDFGNTNLIGDNFWYSTVSQQDRPVDGVNSVRTTSFLTPFDGDIYENVVSSDSLESASSTYGSMADICSPEIPPSEHLAPPARHDREFHSPPPSNAVRPTVFTTNTDEHDPPIVTSDASLSPDASTELIVPKHPCLKCKERPQGFFSDHELQRHINLRHAAQRKMFKCEDRRSQYSEQDLEDP